MMREAIRRAATDFYKRYEDPGRRALMGENYVTLGRAFYARITSLLDALADAETELATARAALTHLLEVIDQTQGITGWHLNGADALWDEFDFVAEARAALPQEGADDSS